ncbi:MAG: glycoside hydrolase family 9 protein [Verrucomicrobiota bacterium]|nr:glycoside hydrolase family 9 protein [Verrucomicrobiota bacterium]
MKKGFGIRLTGSLILAWGFYFLLAASVLATERFYFSTNMLAMPRPGSYSLTLLSPTILEISFISTQEKGGAPPRQWDFVSPNFELKLPDPALFQLRVNGANAPIEKIGFKRRPLYAPLKNRDLRIRNDLYLLLKEPLQPGALAEFSDSHTLLTPLPQKHAITNDPLRWSPVIHVNQGGYLPDHPKVAVVGFYLGSLGELPITATNFTLIDALTGREHFRGFLRHKPDRGYTYSPLPYQNVFEAEFTSFNTPGIYRIRVDGLGASLPFLIDPGAAALFARTYALGLYHQRCGTNNAFPWTRHLHDSCHLRPVEIPTAGEGKINEFLPGVTSDFSSNPRHTAPQLKNVAAALYPFQKKGRLDLTGGHHDAGDYSKYTINSAGLLHYLVFALDHFSGVATLDNLGLPESGDGTSDLLQEALWEARFLSALQDSDGGFYFLVYPRDRKYEDDITPDRGDPQVVWPKNSAATAAASAALAELGSSPLFQKQFPALAKKYLQQAELGWRFLQQAIARHGRDGSYQKLTHYGDQFMHDDELAWLAAALFAATGDPLYEQKLIEWLPDPSSPEIRRWTWWRLFEGWGCAIRTYAFAQRGGRLPTTKPNPLYLAKCEQEIAAAADDHVRFSRESAYGTSFPEPAKRNKSAGWYFSNERAFDLVAAYQLTPRPEYLHTIWANLNYEAGCNPLNLPFITGIGYRRQREIVHQYAQNDRRILPPSGIPLGNLQGGFPYLHHYEKELGSLPFPPDGAETAPYPFYDRWGDTFNTTTEFVVMDLARSLGVTAFLMAQTPLKTQPWRAVPGTISGLPKIVEPGLQTVVEFNAPVDLSKSQIVWEARDAEPALSRNFLLQPKTPGENWIEAEALLPDGRRIFAMSSFLSRAGSEIQPNPFFNQPVPQSTHADFVFHFDKNLADEKGKVRLILSGRAKLDISNVGWMVRPSGAALKFGDLGDTASVTFQSSRFANPAGLSIEAMIYIDRLRAYNRSHARILSLAQDWNAQLELVEDKYAGLHVRGGSEFALKGSALTDSLPPKKWHHLKISLDSQGYKLFINGKLLHQQPSGELRHWKAQPLTLELGNFDGWIDEVILRAE